MEIKDDGDLVVALESLMLCRNETLSPEVRMAWVLELKKFPMPAVGKALEALKQGQDKIWNVGIIIAEVKKWVCPIGIEAIIHERRQMLQYGAVPMIENKNRGIK